MKVITNFKKMICFALLSALFFSIIPAVNGEAGVRGPIDPGWNLTPEGYVNSAGQVIPGALARGIDVSLYQGKINWGSVAADGITFAFIRYGSEKNGVDARFRENMNGAHSAGIRTGVYIYSRATTIEAAVHEANLILGAIGDLTVSFPIVIDMEDDVMKSVSKQGLTEVANAFCAVIEAAGYHPMVYASTNWYRDRMNPVAYDKWVAQYNLSCSDSQRKIWQATDKGGVNGISGRVDINFMFHDYFSEIISTGFKVRKGHTYFYQNWKMQTGWVDFDGGRYFMDHTGRMQTGWIHDGTAMFYLYDNGAMAVGLIQIGDFWYFFDDKGRMQTGMVKIGGSDYMFNEEGKMQTGFIFDGAHTYYFSGGGRVVSALIQIDEDTYYFDNKGRRQTGPVKINGAQYMFNAEGKMQTGLVFDGTHTYYFDGNGMAVSTMLELDESIYYFDSKGRMQTGPVKINGAQHMFNAEGKMQTGWFFDGTYTYYLTPAMTVSAMIELDGDNYYFNKEGRLQTGLFKIGNSSYYSDAEGKLIKDAMVQTDEITHRYFGADGIMVTNAWIQIGDQLYQFNKNGVLADIKPAG